MPNQVSSRCGATLLGSALGYFRAFIAERAQDPSLKTELARALSCVGAITELIRSRAEAEGEKKAVAIFEELLVSRPEDVEIRRPGLALSWRSLGGCGYEAGDPSAAGRALRKAIGLWQRLLDDAPTAVSYRLELARTYNELAMPRGNHRRVTRGRARMSGGHRHRTETRGQFG